MDEKVIKRSRWLGRLRRVDSMSFRYRVEPSILLGMSYMYFYISLEDYVSKFMRPAAPEITLSCSSSWLG